MSAVRGRILVVGLMGNRQGTEMAVDNFVRAVGGRVGFDYLLHEEPAFEACRLPGNRAFMIPRKSRDPLGYRKGLKRLFAEHSGEWSAVWLNTGNLANIDSLVLAERHGVPRRIVHAHSDTWLGGARQIAMTRVNRRRALSIATDRWACSEGAGRLFFGDSPYVFVPNAVSFERYAFCDDERGTVREELGLEGRFVIGSVGALIPRKNHAHVVHILPEIAKRIPEVCLLVVGEGQERDCLVELAEKLGVGERLVLPGGRDEVPALLSAMDAFAFPSIHEGLALALIEAQANGLPVVASSACTRDVAITDAIRFIDLEDGAAWVDALCSANRAQVRLNERSELFDLSREGDFLAELFSFGEG